MKYRIFFILLYAFAAWMALKLAFMLRFYFDPLPFRYDEMLLQTLPLVMICKALAADVFGLTRSMWRYASFRDLKAVTLAALTGSLLFLPLVWWAQGAGYPNGPLLLDLMLCFGFFTVIRFSGRFWDEGLRLFRGKDHQNPLRVLVLGADLRGQMALRFLQEGSPTPVRVLGFLDDDPVNIGRRLLGVPILGSLADLPGILDKHLIQELVISDAKAGPEKIREVFEMASPRGCRVSLLPEFTGTGPHANPIRELKMSDFLGRQAVALDPAPLHAALGGMTVLVTGAGGSIGSELCRQIAALPVARLLLLDFSETALFEISEEIGGQNAPVEVLLCDIRFPEDLQAVFDRFRPDVVYHAAACKHVPMMESHPLDAARTNVLGTRNVVACAKAAGVKRLLHVSTDKVVEAEGIMGASKAYGEAVVRSAGYSCVRFGNVLGSSGSVIPLFEKQWTRDGVLQVTHPEATRYFMTIEEAVQLILHAEALQGTAEVYILDMGEPVKILDLARQMISMKRGQKSEVGGQGEEGISIVGLRAGERVHERLHTEREALEGTPVPKVNKLSGVFSDAGLAEALQALESAVAKRDEAEIRSRLLGARLPVGP